MKKLITLLAILLIMGCTTSTTTGYEGLPDDWFPWDTTCYIHGRLQTEVVFKAREENDQIEVRKLPEGFDTLNYYQKQQLEIVTVNIYDLWPREMCQ